MGAFYLNQLCVCILSYYSFHVHAYMYSVYMGYISIFTCMWVQIRVECLERTVDLGIFLF